MGNEGNEAVPVRNLKSKIQNLKFSLAAAALSGLLLVACFPKFHWRGVVWVACLPLLSALAGEKRLRRAFLLGYVCGAFFFAGNCYWFTTVMEFYGHLSPTLAVVVLILFVIIDSTFFGGFGMAVGWAARRSPGWALALSPFLWVAMELARTYLITGFPWNLLGYAVQALGIRQVAAVTGVYGLSFLAVTTSALLAWVFVSSGPREGGASQAAEKLGQPPRRSERHPSSSEEGSLFDSSPPDSGGVTRSAPGWLSAAGLEPRPSVALAGWLLLLLLAQWRLAPSPPTAGKELAILVQPNVPLDEAEMEAWAPWKDPAPLQQLVQFSVSAVEQFSRPAEIQDSRFKIQNEAAAAPIQNPKSKIENPDAVPPIGNRPSKIENPPLLVWAENPAPFFFTRDPVFRNAMENMARQTHTFVIGNTIIPADTNEESITNSAFTLDTEGREVSRYDKIHLVPFGEYVPGWALPGLVHKITSEVGNFVPGTNYPVAKSPGGGIGVFICYEAIIPQLVRKLVANGAGVLVNISNDAWYGDSAAAYQHLEMARLRAIENHRYLLRATNNGLTVVIDPFGRVVQEIPRYQRLAMPAHFDFETEVTFYTKYGDVFAWLCAAVGALMLVGGSLKGEG